MPRPVDHLSSPDHALGPFWVARGRKLDELDPPFYKCGVLGLPNQLGAIDELRQGAPGPPPRSSVGQCLAKRNVRY